MPISPAQILKLAPHAKVQYTTCFDNGASILDRYGINTNLRIAHFMAQILHESGAMTILTESLNYSHPERLMSVWPSRFPTRQSALPFVGQPEKLAEKVYGGRMGNRQPGDGWKYIGRGLLQVTGRGSYEHIGEKLNIALPFNPDLAFTPPYALQIAAFEWEESGCNEAADSDDVASVTRRINGGQIGLEERKFWLGLAKVYWKT